MSTSLNLNHTAPIMFKSFGSRTFAINTGDLWYGEAIALISDLSAGDMEGPTGERYALMYLYPDGTPSVPLFCHEMDAAMSYICSHWAEMLLGTIERRRIDEE